MRDELSNSYTIVINDALQLVADIEGSISVAQPPGVPNHPVWILGHLVYSAQAIGEELGLSNWLPIAWTEPFSTGSLPQSDASRYPSMHVLIAAIKDAHSRLVKHLRQMNDEQLSSPLPDSRYRTVFPTVGHAALHILACHTSFHVGQLSIWRKAICLPPVPIV